MNGGVVVIGAGGGIGSAVCRRLSAAGVPVVATGRDSARLEAVAGETGAVAVPGDAVTLGHVEACVKMCEERFGALAGAVNCAGSLILKPAHLTTPEEFASTISTNLVTAFNLVRAAAQAMSGGVGAGGSIVLCSSAVARHGFANHEAISAAKAGVIGLALSAAATYAGKGVRINCVSPGLTRTPLTERLCANEASLKASTAMHALGRIGEGDDVAAMIAFLLSDEARQITGQVIAVDGGLGSLRPR